MILPAVLSLADVILQLWFTLTAARELQKLVDEQQVPGREQPGAR